MPNVKTALEIPSSRVDDVWPHLVDFERFPTLMSSVVSVHFVERSMEAAVSEWVVELNETELGWVERDVFYAPNRIEFESIEGDLEVFRGYWELVQDGPNTVVTLSIDFDLGIASLSDVLDPVAIEAIKTNSSDMLNAIRQVMQ